MSKTGPVPFTTITNSIQFQYVTRTSQLLYIVVRVNEANYVYIIYTNLRSNVLCLCFDILNKKENKLYIISNVFIFISDVTLAAH